MSKKLGRAIAEGKVEVKNRTAGEVNVMLSLGFKQTFAVTVPGYGTAELAPKHVSPKMVKRSHNLASLIEKGILKVL